MLQSQKRQVMEYLSASPSTSTTQQIDLLEAPTMAHGAQAQSAPGVQGDQRTEVTAAPSSAPPCANGAIPRRRPSSAASPLPGTSEEIHIDEDLEDEVGFFPLKNIVLSLE